jgi:hypothetical protein
VSNTGDTKALLFLLFFSFCCDRKLENTLTQLALAHNDYEGDLNMVANSHLMIVSVHDNPRLCGMVPASVRYAKGYNPAGTRLGQPC